MIDCRNEERVKAAPVLRYWTKDRSMMISQANDVSHRGISFNTGKEYKKGTPVYIQMRIPYDRDKSVTFKAKVVHQELNKEAGLFKTGAQIVGFHEDDSNILDGYVSFMSQLRN